MESVSLAHDASQHLQTIEPVVKNDFRISPPQPLQSLSLNNNNMSCKTRLITKDTIHSDRSFEDDCNNRYLDQLCSQPVLETLCAIGTSQRSILSLLSIAKGDRLYVDRPGTVEQRRSAYIRKHTRVILQRQCHFESTTGQCPVSARACAPSFGLPLQSTTGQCRPACFAAGIGLGPRV